MQNWEFWIQKQGESAWLPIKAATDLEEGKYRIVAHTERPNLEVEIRIVYQGEKDGLALRVSQKHRRQTNSEGLVVIVDPYTYLKSGEWKITCYGDIMDELLGEAWQETLHLQVCPQGVECKPSKELVFTAEAEPTAEPEEVSSSFIDPSVWQELSEAELASDAVLTEFDLAIYQDTFVKQEGQPIIVSGQIDVISSDLSSHWELVQAGLRYLLRDSQTAEILLNFEQLISEQRLPLIFSHTIEIPAQWQSRLLLGEIILEVPAQLTETSEELLAVASQTFTVTPDVNQLIKAGSTEAQEGKEAADILESIFSSQTELIRQRRLNLFDPQKNHIKATMQLRPSSGEILPPKISDASTGKPQTPQLPKLPPKETFAASAMVQQSELFASAKKDTSSIDQAFEALNLPERFLSRLNSLLDEPEASPVADQPQLEQKATSSEVTTRSVEE